MVNHVGRKVVFILSALALAAAFLLGRGIHLGLDLKGGARLVYGFDLETARGRGELEGLTNTQVLLQNIAVLGKRLDKTGVADISVVAQPPDEILIELPGLSAQETDNVKRLITTLGDLEWRLLASSEFDLDQERQKLDVWRSVNPGLGIAFFADVPPAEGGPTPGLRWFPIGKEEDGSPRSSVGGPGRGWTDFAPVRMEEHLETGEDRFVFRGSDLASVRASTGPTGEHAVAFEFVAGRRHDFEEYTEAHQGRQLAILLNGELSSAPVIQSVLPGGGQISGGGRFGFSIEEVRELTTILESGSLRLVPELRSEQLIGPSLGADSIKVSRRSGMLSLGFIMAFLLVIYRQLGVLSACSLILNLCLVMGGLAFFGATLTLPGLAGIILTIGMAVDANILIFERIREERDSGRDVAQAFKNGFERAATTIVDANLTTLITALILFQVGTGPVRGFAVTLAIGILTSVFSALVITKLVCHLLVGAGAFENLRMTRLVGRTRIPFLNFRLPAAALSLVAIVAGLSLFVTRGTENFGIDFHGGQQVRFRLSAPMAIGELRGVAAGLWDSPVVNEVRGTAADGTALPAGVSDQFVVKVARRAGQAEIDMVTDLRSALGERLRPSGISSVSVTEDGSLTLSIHLETPPPTGALMSLATAAGIADPTLEMTGPLTWTLSGRVPTQIGTGISDVLLGEASGVGVRLSDPFPEVTEIGERLVQEHRDKAILALFFSLVAIVLYIRVRFLEYSYGFAAVCALVHDVLMTLGAIAAAAHFGLVDVEIDLAMIAAFLTIIGYSLNDTIVVFDRIRENLPRTDGSFSEVINLSINQTLGRTVLTSITTLLVVVTLLVFNRGMENLIEGFAFAMVVGVFVGTYSSIFVASPLLIVFGGHKELERVRAEAAAGSGA